MQSFLLALHHKDYPQNDSDSSGEAYYVHAFSVSEHAHQIARNNGAEHEGRHQSEIFSHHHTLVHSQLSQSQRSAGKYG